MIYRTRPGIVLLRICDAEMLVATRKVWEECPKIRPVPRLWAGCWALMEKGRTSEEVIDFFCRLYNKPEEEIRQKFNAIFEKLYSEGFLIAEEESA